MVARTPQAEGYLVLQGCAELLLQVGLLLHPLPSGLAVLLCQLVQGALELLQVTSKLAQLRQMNRNPHQPGSKLAAALLFDP